jgi:hypothetical protein
MDSDHQLTREGFASIGKTFRGDIWQFVAQVPMGKGYSNKGKDGRPMPFDIFTAHYLKPIFQAIKDPNILKVVIKMGVQMLKTFLCEMSAAYFIVNDPGDMTLYDCDQEASSDHCKSRMMPFLHSIPEIAGQIKEVASRHDVTITEFYLPGMTFRAWPLNLSSTQRITLRYVFIHDAFLSQRTGLINEAIARTTQHPHDKKIIIESQASDEGDDFDLQYEGTDKRELWIKCPLCGNGQAFEWSRQRDDGSYSGFNRGPDEKIKTPDGGYSSDSVKEWIFFECFHCRGQIRDNTENRSALDASSYYVSTNPSAPKDEVGFCCPAWINTRIPWHKIMMEYLIAKRTAREFGNKEPLRQWYQKRAAKTWNERLEQPKVATVIGSYDPHKVIENEHHRGLVIDCQKHLEQDTVGTFWFEVYAADKQGNSFQLERGWCDSWEKLREVQAKWKIPNNYVCIDGRKWTPEVLRRCAMYREWVPMVHPLLKTKMMSALVWKVLLGDGPAKSYPWNLGNEKMHKVWSVPTMRPEIIINEKGGRERILVPMYRWSNWSVKEQLNDLRIGGEGRPKFEALSREQLSPEMQAKETGDLTYENQMNSETKGLERGKETWIKIRPNNHYWDLACMRIVRMAMDSLLGHNASPE